jgi:hypothetical protein
MTTLVQDRLGELQSICRRHAVRRLSLFGSAAGARFDPNTSDLDFLVDFESMKPAQYADSYFGLLEDLQGLFGMDIDLVERAPIRNPYFLASIEASQVDLFHAA